MRTINNKTGLGIIDIVSDGFASCLKIDRIVAADCYDGGGTVAHYYEIADFKREDVNAIATRMNEALMHGSHDQVLDEVTEFLLLFEPGEYTLKIYENVTSYDYASDSYYPSRDIFLNLTAHPQTLDEERIRFYMNVINEGHAPKLVVFRKIDRPVPERPSANPDVLDYAEHNFVLDGHHKLMAYERLKVPVALVLITAFFEEGKSPLDDARLLLDAVPMLSDQFRNHWLLAEPKVLTGDSEEERKYNKLLDQMLRDCERLDISFQNLLKTNISSSDPFVRRWAQQRLRAFYSGFGLMQKPKMVYIFLPDKKQWVGEWCTEPKAFLHWCLRFFGSSYEALTAEISGPQ